MDDFIRATFAYDPLTGLFVRKMCRMARFVGPIPRCANDRGYHLLRFTYKGKFFSKLSHRVAFFLMEGRWPEGVIDHINGHKQDNRWSNLRHVTRELNLVNSARATQHRNVIRINGRYYPLVGEGFSCPHEAALVAETL